MRICFFGDSFTLGVGDPEGLGWVGRVSASAKQEGLDLTTYNLGVRRETSADIAARWRQEAERRFPEGEDCRLVFSFGVNDCCFEDGIRRLPHHRSMDIARTVLSEANSIRPVLFVGPPPIGEAPVNDGIERLSNDLEHLCDQVEIPFLDVVGPLSGSPVWRKQVEEGDGAHPGAEGYAEFAERVAGWDAWRAWISG